MTALYRSIQRQLYVGGGYYIEYEAGEGLRKLSNDRAAVRGTS